MTPSTFCVDIDDAVQRITARTAGVIVVHLAGLIDPRIEEFSSRCRERGLFVLEDASHAHGAALAGRKAGSLADAGCFSFYPTKILTSGTGGMITTNNQKLAEYARQVRHHGMARRGEQFMLMGNDWCMSEIHAILGRYQLARVDESVAHRNRVVEWYRNGLAGVDWLTIPSCPATVRHAYYKLPTVVGEGIDRDRLRQILEDEYKIENGTVYDPPCHLQPALKNALGLARGAFPQAERALSRQLCPPVHRNITQEQVGSVIEAMHSVIDRCRLNSGTLQR